MKLERSVYEILQIIGISLTYKTHLRNLFDKSDINNVNERFGFSEPSLFNFNRPLFLVDTSGFFLCI